MPAIPHYTSECLEDLGNIDFVSWPKTNKDLLIDDKIDYVIQINGKKRLILNENRNTDQESLLLKVKSNKVAERYLKDQEIKKIIFVKNRLINILVNE